jgi:hypothetical protein
LISAYNDTNSGSFVIVAVNPNVTSIGQTFNLNAFPGLVSSVTPWITSGTMTLSNQTSVGVSGSMFSYTLPAMSVVTFVGQVSQAQAIPTINITGDGNSVTVYWQNVPGWSLQQNDDLTNPGGWSVNSSWTTSNGTNYLNLIPPTGTEYFRLSNP